MRIEATRATWVCSALLVTVAASTLAWRSAPSLPGVLEFGVLMGPGETRTQAAMRPLAEYLSEKLRRAVRLRCVSVDEFRNAESRFDLALLSGPLLEAWPEAEVLAWAKGPQLQGPRPRPFVVYRRSRPWSELTAPRLILGDSLTWEGGAGATDFLARQGHPISSFAAVAHGSNPYDHGEALAALAHGAFDLAIVREADARQALAAGPLLQGDFLCGPAGEEGAGFALVASARLPERARRKVRDAALELDVLRYESDNLRVALVLEGMADLGLGGFAPAGLLPSLRP